MKKKRTKKGTSARKKVGGKETRDQYTIVLEGIRDQFRVFGEALSDVSDSVDEVRKDIKELRERVARIEMELEFVKEQLSEIRHNQVTRNEFRLLETRVARLERSKRYR